MSENNHEASTTTFATFGTLMSLLAIGALVSNIVCFRMTRRLARNKPAMALVLNLNACDTMVALISWAAFMMQHIAEQAGYMIPYSVIIHKVVWSILVGLGNVTILNLVGLAADCFVALRWPLHYKEIATKRTVNIFIAIVWISSIIVGSGDFLTAATRTTEELSFVDAIRDSYVLTQHNTKEKLAASISMLMSNSLSFISLITMMIMYGYILYKIRTIRSNTTLSKQGGSFRSEINAVRTTLMIFTSFLLLWLPTLIINILSVIKPDFLSKLNIVEASFVGYTADTLLMVHSIVDAAIYGRRVFKTIGRQRKSRRDQTTFSRENTLRRASSGQEKTVSIYLFNRSHRKSSYSFLCVLNNTEFHKNNNLHGLIDVCLT